MLFGSFRREVCLWRRPIGPQLVVGIHWRLHLRCIALHGLHLLLGGSPHVLHHSAKHPCALKYKDIHVWVLIDLLPTVVSQCRHPLVLI